MRYPQLYIQIEKDLNAKLQTLPSPLPDRRNAMSVMFVRRSALLNGTWSPEGLRLVADSLDKLQQAHAEAHPKKPRKDLE